MKELTTEHLLFAVVPALLATLIMVIVRCGDLEIEVLSFITIVDNTTPHSLYIYVLRHDWIW